MCMYDDSILTSSADALYTQLSESMRVRECIRAYVCMKASSLCVRTYYQT